MKVRLQLLVSAFIFSVFGPASSPAVTLPPSFNWVTAPVDGLLTNASNWVGGIAPSTGADLVFGSTSHPFVNFDTSLDVNSITFTSGYSPYFFGATSVQTLRLSNGITLPTSSTATVHFGPNVSIKLLQSQTWAIDGSLTVHGNISEPTATPSTLTKTGAGTLTLGGSNAFSGGVNVQQGTLRLGFTSFEESEPTINDPVGTGTLSLASGTTLASDVDDLDLHNDITLGSAVTNNHVTFDTGDFGGLFLDGDLTAGSADTTIYLAGENTLEIIGTIDGPAQTDLVFASAGPDIGSAAFGATFTSNIQSITADNAALFFFIAPSSPLTLAAVNRGYIGAAVNVEDVAPISPTALLSQIANPGSYAGTFGVDTDPDMGTPHFFTEALDFTHFTHPDFRFGSHTMSVVAGPISPVVNGTTSLYPFGGGSGHLAVASDLVDAPGAPASVLVSSHAGTEPQYVILRGNNSFTGSYTLDGVAAQLAVQRAIAVLDSPTALPGTSSTFTFGASEHAYIGATEAAFPSFNSFLARLAPGGHNPLSILGLDSRNMFDVKIAHGEEAENYTPRQVNEVIELRSFASIYLGSASDVQINRPIYAPTDGVLRLTGVDDGRLTVAAPLGDNVTSVEIGSSAGGSEEFGDGTVEMRAPQTYSGGTTLRSGRLAIGSNTHFNHETQTIVASPIGTGALTVMPGVSQAILSATNAYSEFYNTIILNASLQIGERFIPREVPMITSETNTTLLNLYSDISGSGGLKIYRAVTLAGNNTYSGGTEINSSWVQAQSANAFGTGTITFRSDEFDASVLSSNQPLTLTNALSISGNVSFFTPYAETHLAGPISLESPAELQFASGSKVKITGAISGMHSLSISSNFGGDVWIGDSVANPPTNTYSGGTNVWSGAVVFANPSAIPVNGKLYANYGGYIGAAFGSDLQSSFLERFDKAGTTGTIGFDSTDAAMPTVVSDPINLTDFNSTARLGSSTVAIITGTITPSSGGYQFGGGGGELTIASNLDGNRFINVNTSSTDSPLTLILQGDNSAANGLSVVRSIVRLDGAAALPSGYLNVYDYGYVGYTENVSGLTPATFLGKFGTVGPNAIIGFDSANPQSPRTISDNISLGAYSTIFPSSTYIGTSTAISLTGTLTAHGSTLNLTGVGHGRLMVDSVITPANATHLVIGTPEESISGGASVTLNKANSYTGGTTLQDTHLVLGHASALGTGTLTNDGDHGQLSVNEQAAGAIIANLINTGTAGDELNLNGPNNFTLSGDISGSGDLSKTGSSVVTLSGNNSAFTGGIWIREGSMAFTQDTSAGFGGLEFASLHGATVQFLSSAPSIGSLMGDHSDDQIILAPNATLTVNQHYLDDGVYQGTISGSGASVVFQTQTNSILNGGAAPLTETSIPVRAPRITLYGANTYSGGTTIRDGVTVVAANSAALGTVGNVTIDGGTLAISPGTSLTFDTTSTRQLVFTSGRIAGQGAIALANNLTIGAQQTLSPGLDFTGQLSFNLASSAVLTFASGGTYQWKLADAGGAPTGWGTLQVTGTVDITAGTAPGSTFDLELHTVNPSGSSGFAANFNPYVSMSWAVLTATNITNFDPAKFNIVTTDFLNATNGGAFSLKLLQDSSSSTLLLTFTPVPEPSTWALLLSGLAVVAFTALRRRK